MGSNIVELCQGTCPPKAGHEVTRNCFHFRKFCGSVHDTIESEDKESDESDEHYARNEEDNQTRERPTDAGMRERHPERPRNRPL